MKDQKLSRRGRLLWLAETGRLRDALSHANVDQDVQDLVVDICLRYSVPRRKRRSRTPTT